MTPLPEFLAKLTALAEGALKTIDEKRNATVQKPVFTDFERQRNWWDGYLQAVTDIADFAGKGTT